MSTNRTVFLKTIYNFEFSIYSRQKRGRPLLNLVDQNFTRTHTLIHARTRVYVYRIFCLFQVSLNLVETDAQPVGTLSFQLRPSTLLIVN